MSGSKRAKQGPCAPKESKGRFTEGNRPRERRALKQWVNDHLEIHVPDVRICAGHSSPMDYLWHAYRSDDASLRPTGQISGDCIVWANRGGGKTLLAAVATLLEGVLKANCRTRIVAGSLNQAGCMYEYLTGFAADYFPESIVGRMLREQCRFIGGTHVRILSQSQRAVRGQHVHKLRCDEVELFKEEIFNAAKFCTLSSEGLSGAMECLSTMHRPYGLMQKIISEAAQVSVPIFKWCLWEVIEKCTSDRGCSRCALASDCGGKARQADGYLRIDDCIAQMRRSSRAGFEAEMLCLRPSLENAVFADFDPAVHVKEIGYDGNLPLYRAIDFGFVNPFVCLWIQVDRAGVVRVIDEYVESRKTIQVHAREIKRQTPCREPQVAGTFCDPAGKQTSGSTGTSLIKDLRDHGIRATSKGSRILDSLEWIRRRLRAGDGQSRLVISPKCARLIEAMRCYHYPPGARGDRAELPVKDGMHDHPIDALRYFFANMEISRKVSKKRF